MILTNNVKVREKYNAEYIEGNQIDVLKKARDFVHMGYELVSSPIAASGRMHFSPVRLVILTDVSKNINQEHIKIIEASISSLEKSLSLHEVDVKNIEGYKIIDYELLTSALQEVETLNISLR